LRPDQNGTFEGIVRAQDGCDYCYALDDGPTRADPCSRWQPLGLHGPSRVLNTNAFPWTETDWAGLSLDDLVIYELHVGTFSEAGNFDGVADRLVELRDLGVTAIELMPIGVFPGSRNWGYDGVYIYAPDEAYGGPEALARLVDRAHREGLGVILDVVYNHLGPFSDAVTPFGPYFTSRHSTGWGDAINYDEQGVREWAIQNAEMWIRDYHIDGLRLDATHAIHDDRQPHVLAELAERVRRINPRVLVISEMETGDLRPITEWGHDAQWADEFHHQLHVLLTGEQEGYYRDYDKSVDALAENLLRTPAEKLVFCSQNHDQVGNRALGDRPSPGELRIRAAALLFAPQIPLLFMGEEYGEQHRFQFFTDHPDPMIADATREGRKEEFADFTTYSGQDIPDPQDPATFKRSRLHPENGDAELAAFYKQLLELRRSLPAEIETEADEAARTLRLRRGRAELILNFSTSEQLGVPGRDAALLTPALD
jgi:maltooligosyltrehalose trehalohydrolase